MTKIVFFRSNGVFYGFEEQGHTGYGEEGDDVLCAALSAMTMLIINTIEISYASDVEYNIDEATTDISVKSKAALIEYEDDERKTSPVRTSAISVMSIIQLSIHILPTVGALLPATTILQRPQPR